MTKEEGRRKKEKEIRKKRRKEKGEEKKERKKRKRRKKEEENRKKILRMKMGHDDPSHREGTCDGRDLGPAARGVTGWHAEGDGGVTVAVKCFV